MRTRSYWQHARRPNRAEENRITPDTGRLSHSSAGMTRRIEQKRTGSRRTPPPFHSPSCPSETNRAEENRITPDTSRSPMTMVPVMRRIEQKRTGSRRTPDSDPFVQLTRLDESSRREPDHAGHYPATAWGPYAIGESSRREPDHAGHHVPALSSVHANCRIEQKRTGSRRTPNHRPRHRCIFPRIEQKRTGSRRTQPPSDLCLRELIANRAEENRITPDTCFRCVL